MPRGWTWIPGVIPVEHIRGVYALYDEGRLVYVGHSGNIRNRLQAHTRRFFFDSAKFAEIDGIYDRQRLERKLIYRLRPRQNRVIHLSPIHWRDRF